MLEQLSRSQPIGRMAQPQEAASLALFLCSNEASFITGTDYRLDLGASNGRPSVGAGGTTTSAFSPGVTFAVPSQCLTNGGTQFGIAGITPPFGCNGNLGHNPFTTPNIEDKRSKPPGVLPKNMQAWVLSGVALVMVGVIALSGKNPPKQRVSARAGG